MPKKGETHAKKKLKYSNMPDKLRPGGHLRKRQKKETDELSQELISQLPPNEPPVYGSNGKLSPARVHFFETEDNTKYSLTRAQKRFADYYVASFGNRLGSVDYAGYPAKTLNNKAAYAWLCLKTDSVRAYINMKLQKYGFSDDNVKKQHAFLINQHHDLTNKKGGIDMYYKLMGSYAPEKREVRVEKVEVIDYAAGSKVDAVEAEVVEEDE